MNEDDTDEITLDLYEVSNLIGLLRRAREHDNGDWYCQTVRKLIEFCKKNGVKKFINNFGDEIEIDDFEYAFHCGAWDDKWEVIKV